VEDGVISASLGTLVSLILGAMSVTPVQLLDMCVMLLVESVFAHLTLKGISVKDVYQTPGDMTIFWDVSHVPAMQPAR